MSAVGPEPTCRDVRGLVAMRTIADLTQTLGFVRDWLDSELRCGLRGHVASEHL